MRWREDWCCRRIARLRRRVRRRSWGRVRRRRWCRPRRRARAGRGCRPRRRCCRPVDAVLVAVRVRVGVRADPPVAAVRVGARLDRPLGVDDAVVFVIVIVDDRRRAGLAGHTATPVESRVVQRAGRRVARSTPDPAHRRAIVAALNDLVARRAARTPAVAVLVVVCVTRFALQTVFVSRAVARDAVLGARTFVPVVVLAALVRAGLEDAFVVDAAVEVLVVEISRRAIRVRVAVRVAVRVVRLHGLKGGASGRISLRPQAVLHTPSPR